MAKTCAPWITLFLYAAVGAAPLRAQDPTAACPADDVPAQIEVLPFEQVGNTCDFLDQVRMYGGTTCRIQRVDYSGPDPIYKVRLNPGNRGVAFHLDLDVDPSADLVLALLSRCGDGASCVNSSPDFIGGGAEEISAAAYPPGVYYLMIDSAADRRGHCGAYRLTVTGTNPTPDLSLVVTAPESAVAGTTLTYTLSVTNSGALDATGLLLTQTLPPGTSLSSASPGCLCVVPGKVLCSIDRLPIGAQVSRQVTVKLNPAVRGTLFSLATVRSIEGDPTPANNESRVTTRVIAQSDLSITKDASRASVVAGKDELTYTLKVRNHGPSDANQVVVTDDLPAEVDSPSAPGCTITGLKVTCPIGKLAPGARAQVTIQVGVKSSAFQSLRNHASVAALEPGLVELVPGNNAVTRKTQVTRLTDLSVTKTGPDSVVAGDELTYQITVVNNGFSDSMGAVVTDTLPSGVCVVRETGCDVPIQPLTFLTGPLPKGDHEDLSLKIRVASSLRVTQIINKASVTPVNGSEMDRTTTNDSASWVTTVEIQADLGLTKTATPVAGTSTVLAGETLLYTLTVTNHGPSDSSGGTISDPLHADLKLVASPDKCHQDQEGGPVICPVPARAVDESYEARFVVKVAAGAPGPITNQATVIGNDPDPDGGNDSNIVLTTPVSRQADLAVSLSDSPDPVREGVELTYTLTLTNGGPSDAANVTVALALAASPVLDSTPPDCTASLTDMGLDGSCSLVPAGSSKIFKVHVVAPAASETPLLATAHVSSAAMNDPMSTNDTAVAQTALVEAGVTAADLAVTKSAEVEAVVAGDLLRYTLEVVNHGPDVATEVKVEDPLMAGLTLVVPIDPVDCTGLESSVSGVTWSVGDLGFGELKRCTFLVRVDPTFTEEAVRNMARVTSAVMDNPNPDNDTSAVETPVLKVPPLILPFFQTDGDPSGASTRFAVRNPAAAPVCAVFEYFPPLTAQNESTCIVPKGVVATEIFHSSTDEHGYVGITPVVDCSRCQTCGGCALPEPTAGLAGDFFRSDSDQGPVGGELLLSTITVGRPSELCRRWVTRFVGSRSEVVFFIPELPAGGATAQGRVYNEAGDFVQTVKVPASEKAFRRTIGDLKAGEQLDDGVLASAGTIEWELPEGILGNLSATLRAAGNAVALPGICRRPPAVLDLGAEPPLLLPYFKIDRTAPTGPTTLFAVRNLTDREVQVHYEYLRSDGMLDLDEPPIALAGHAMRSVDLRNVAGLTADEGFLRITPLPDVADSGRREQILGGDYIRRDDTSSQKDRAAGSALVNTGRLCRRWDVRFIQKAGTTTNFVFYLGAPETPVTGKAYDNDGQLVSGFQAPTSTSAAFEVSAGALGLENQEGSVEWELGAVGHVAAVFRNENVGSVLVPGVCRDLEVP
jgi:uncharacterized repeat protein (TIGR01451 family)